MIAENEGSCQGLEDKAEFRLETERLDFPPPSFFFLPPPLCSSLFFGTTSVVSSPLRAVSLYGQISKPGHGGAQGPSFQTQRLEVQFTLWLERSPTLSCE